MSVLVNKESKVIVQGFTGGEGTFHSEQMIEFLNIESDEMMMAISITNADGIEEILVSRNAFAQARQYGHFQFSGSRKGSLGRKRMI